MRTRRHIAIAVCTGWIYAASAQTIAYSPDSGRTSSQIVLSIPVTASVSGRCGFADGGVPGGSHNHFYETGLLHDFSFALNCTRPSRVATVLENSGFLTTGTATTGYATRAPMTSRCPRPIRTSTNTATTAATEAGGGNCPGEIALL